MRIARGLTGFDPRRLAATVLGTPAFLRSLLNYRKANVKPTFAAGLRDLYPVLHEMSEPAANIDPHYLFQDLWAARKIYARRPMLHVDVGSRLDGFITHLLTFMPVHLVDVRPLDLDIQGLHFLQDDATRLRSIPDGSVESLSSLHAAEHFGLGRYSPEIEPEACFQFMDSLARVLAPGGSLYFAVPVGRERVEFNAHRVFTPATILASFPTLTLLSFAFVDDQHRFHDDADPGAAAGCEYGCGLFEFQKALGGNPQ